MKQSIAEREHEPDTHGWQAESGCVLDAWLRDAGFTIKERLPGKEPKWGNAVGKLMTESQAIKSVTE